MRFLRYNTATRVTVGPFLAVADGITPVINITATNCWLSLTIDANDGGAVSLVKDTALTGTGGANDMITVPSDVNGLYDLELAAGDTDTYGRLFLSIVDTDVHLPVFHEFQIISAVTYDAWFGTGPVSANVTQFGGTNLTAASGIPAVNATQINGTTQTARDLGASVLLSPGTGTGQISLTSGAVSLAATPPTAGAIADAVWDETFTSHSTDDTYGIMLQPLAMGTAAAGGASTITLDGDAVATANFYDGNSIQIISGTGAGQAKVISSYAANRVATVSEAWATQPNNTSKYIIRALGDVEVGVNNDKTGYSIAATTSNAVIAGAVWDAATASYGTAGTYGALVESGNVGGGAIVAASVTGAVGSIASSGIVAASIATGAITAAKFAANAIDAAALAADAVGEIADAVCDEVISTGHTTANSLAKIMYDNLNAPVATADTAIDAIATTIGTAGAGLTALPLNLASYTGFVVETSGSNSATQIQTSLASSTDDFWIGAMILITSGACSGQVKTIGDYTGSTGVVVLKSGDAWTSTPADGVTGVILNR